MFGTCRIYVPKKKIIPIRMFLRLKKKNQKQNSASASQAGKVCFSASFTGSLRDQCMLQLIP